MAFDAGDIELIELASSSASLDASPNKNWVENAGGLPPYVRKLARGIMKSGKSKSQAIAIAISRVKKWSAGGDDVDADTRAKSAKAVAQWEAAKAKNKGKKVIKASRGDGQDYLMLSSIGSYNTDMVRRAWDARERMRRAAHEVEHPRSGNTAPESEMYPYRWVREVWSDYIIVENEGSTDLEYLKFPYVYDDGEIIFGEPTEVKQVWEEVDDDGDLSALERDLLKDIYIVASSKQSPLEIISGLVKGG
jgi:hypothetical protein